MQDKATEGVIVQQELASLLGAALQSLLSCKNDGKSSQSHSPWVGQRGSWVTGKEILPIPTSLLVDTFRHNDAVYHISFFLPNLSAGFMGRLFIKLSLVHRDLIRYSLNITRRINYHCYTRATEEVKCFSFAWAESICLKCSQYH